LVRDERAGHVLVIQPVAIIAAHLVNVLLGNYSLQPLMLCSHNLSQSNQLPHKVKRDWAMSGIGYGIVWNVGEHFKLRIPRSKPSCTASIRCKNNFMTSFEPSVN
jgi:hypothetical protein